MSLTAKQRIDDAFSVAYHAAKDSGAVTVSDLVARMQIALREQGVVLSWSAAETQNHRPAHTNCVTCDVLRAMGREPA